MYKKNKIFTKPFVIISILSVLLVGFFVVYIMTQKNFIIKDGKEFEAKCIDTYTRNEGSGSKGLDGHNKMITIYVFEVSYPNELKGEKFEKTKGRYRVGITYRGKYIENGENYNKIMKNRYEYEIME